MSSTLNSGEGWGELLKVLSDEELDQYATLANDQVRQERRWVWIQLIMLAAAIGLTVWLVWRAARQGPDMSTLYASALAIGLIYWPWRSAKVCRLWKRHSAAVGQEVARRRQDAA